VKAQVIVALLLAGCGSSATLGVGPTFATDGTVRFEVQLTGGPSTYGMEKSGLLAEATVGEGALGTRKGSQLVLGAGVGGAMVADSGPSGHLGLGYLQRVADVPQGRVTLYGGELHAGIAAVIGSGPAPTSNGCTQLIDLCNRRSRGDTEYFLLGGGLQPRFFAGSGHTRGELFVPLEVNLWQL